MFRSNDIVNFEEIDLNDFEVLYDKDNYQNMQIVNNIELSEYKTVLIELLESKGLAVPENLFEKQCLRK